MCTQMHGCTKKRGGVSYFAFDLILNAVTLFCVMEGTVTIAQHIGICVPFLGRKKLPHHSRAHSLDVKNDNTMWRRHENQLKSFETCPHLTYLNDTSWHTFEYVKWGLISKLLMSWFSWSLHIILPFFCVPRMDSGTMCQSVKIDIAEDYMPDKMLLLWRNLWTLIFEVSGLVNL